MQICVLANQIVAFCFCNISRLHVPNTTRDTIFLHTSYFLFRACADELPLATCKTVPERPTLQKRFKKLCLIMLMSLLKSTITKWHIFTPDFDRRVSMLTENVNIASSLTY